MPVDNRAIRLAVRRHFLDLRVIDLIGGFTPAGNGFSRDNGSFVDDGVLVGLEIVPTYDDGDGTPVIVSGVTDTGVEVIGEVDSVRVPLEIWSGFPKKVAWENVDFDPTDQRWYASEEYLPGTSRLFEGTYLDGWLEVYPTYILHLFGVSGLGPDAIDLVSDRIVDLFPPGLALIPDDNHVVLVRGDPAPFKGQLVPDGEGHAEILITIPFWVRTRTP